MRGVLDSWAVLAMFRAEPAGPRVIELISSSETVISSVNLGEVFYWTIRERNLPAAEAAIEELRKLVAVEESDWELVHAAALVKARGGISYPDAFCVATAQRHEAPLYTGDPEILALTDLVELVDLRPAPNP